jgi:2-succinyl-5-enolpyruvyl-6-hydroxy-3-cyclohexene-1-carboxylate synthase
VSISQTILDIAEICAQQQITKLILSSGSRNAPLTLAFSRHPAISTRLISDERVAGYVALGIAQSLKEPAILLSTSGTAVLNFGPAIAEAYYQHIPLLVFTADRPPEWIDQNDGQAIRQRNVFENHVKKSFELPVSLDHEDAKWQLQRTVNEAIITARIGVPGPVHINVPLREPLYPDTGQPWEYHQGVPVINFRQPKKALHQDQWESLQHQWESATQILIVGGQGAFSADLTGTLETLQRHAAVPVLGDVVSNLHRVNNVVTHPEIILGQAKLAQFQPDLLITFGGGLVSKNLKLFLRKYPASIHWHVQDSDFPPDTFKSISDIIPLDPEIFFSKLKEYIAPQKNSVWYQDWQKQETEARKSIQEFLLQQDFNELQAVDLVLKAAKKVHLHLANSTPVRWVDLIGVAPETIEISANRGTSGIDGCTSTAVGHALCNTDQHLLITGDMAFFYDRNAFWHQYQIPNLKIVILNNHGGGIFRLLDGPRKQPELEELFVTKQNLTAENLAKDFGMNYLYCNNAQDLTKNLVYLFELYDQACILEIELPNNMGDIYQKLKASIKNNYE